MYPITRAFICTRRRFRFARSIPHTRPDVIRIVPSSRTTHDYGTTGRNIPRRNKRGESQVFLIALSSESLRRPFLLSFPNLDRRESSTLFYARSTLISFKTPLKFPSKNFLIGQRVSRLSIDFTLESRNSSAPREILLSKEISRSIERRIVRVSSSLRRSCPA